MRDITVLIPARNEAQAIPATLYALSDQGRGLRVVVVDDQSTDGTVAAIPRLGNLQLEVIPGQSLPHGWAGKLWALEQGLGHVHTPLILLLDADIELAPGMLAVLRSRLLREGLDLISVMPWLRMQGFWERLLLPAFIFFFKLLYPFRLANAGSARFAAAAGGCILLRTRILRRIGGFESLRDALIDDCTLARRIKAAGGRIWIGLTHCAQSTRPYPQLDDLWNMVARSAFTQLRYSNIALFFCTALMLIAFWGPAAGAVMSTGVVRVVALIGVAAMCVSYLPTLRYYRLSPFWALLLPIIASLYLGMTWTSAVRYWRGVRSRWKGRSYTA